MDDETNVQRHGAAAFLSLDRMFVEGGVLAAFAKRLDIYYARRGDIAQNVAERYRDSVSLIRSLAEVAVERGYKPVIVSCAPDFLVDAVVKGIEVYGLLATEYETAVDGKFTGKIKTNLGQPEVRRDVVRKFSNNMGFDQSKSAYFADSILDIRVLGDIGHMYVIEPEGEFRRMVEENRFIILNKDNAIETVERTLPNLRK